MWTKKLSVELKDDGFTVMVSHPGSVQRSLFLSPNSERLSSLFSPCCLFSKGPLLPTEAVERTVPARLPRRSPSRACTAFFFRGVDSDVAADVFALMLFSLKYFDISTPEADNGRFYNYTGETLPW